ncbi:protein extra-macrochaetae-like [Palaemon carinicauda]|uniref:protein extra-macrochaetae-like n=1 Tax=Palaemon carinicauda TaxID=392227 RepID=UPI0035B5D12A
MKSVNWNKNCHRNVRPNPIGMRSNRCHAEVRQERQEIREYLDKLRQLVPACPKAGKLSRLAVIQYVIDYIVELQDTLVHHPVNSILGSEDIDLTSLHSNPIFSLQALNTSCKNSTAPINTSVANVTISSKNDNNASAKTTTATINNNSKKSKTNNSSSSTCRRPLGVLSSFKNHRNL